MEAQQQHEGFIKIEPDFDFEQTEENIVFFDKLQMFKKEHDMVDDEYQATGQCVNDKIKQDIVYQEPKIEQQSNLSPATERDSLKILTNIKQELDVCKVKEDDMLTGITNIKQELNEYSKLKIETELLTTHCDLPTLKNENIDLDFLEESCSNKQIKRKLKPLNHTTTHVSKYKKGRYPRLVNQKSTTVVPTKKRRTALPSSSPPTVLSSSGTAIVPTKKRRTALSSSSPPTVLSSSGTSSPPAVLSSSGTAVVSTKKRRIALPSSSPPTVLSSSGADLDEKQLVSSKIRVTRNRPRRFKRRKHKCIYCDLPVGNFARHLERQHSDELEVQNIIVLPKRDKLRKEMIHKIRKEGGVCSDNIIPVQETETNDACSKLPENRRSSVLELSGPDDDPDITDSSLHSNTSDPGYIEIQGNIIDSNLSDDTILEDNLDDVLIDQTNSLNLLKEQVHSNSSVTDVGTAVDHNDQMISLPTPPKKSLKLKTRSYKRRRHNCIYCDVSVDNFARHLQRQHADEFEVQNFIMLPKWDKRRKEMIEKIRKEGDFCSGNVIPVQAKETATNDPCSKLPCIFCSGYYSRKTLRRHIKRCPLNKTKNSYNKRQCLSIGHTYMANNFRPNDVLRTSGVLDSLKADEISLVAKRDKIICEVGRKYIKSHKDKHLVDITKRYMRRLARLLIEIRKIENNGSLAIINILHPSKFKTIMKALKAISQYDEVRKTFKSPSLALQMGNLLKKAISAAYYLEIRSNKNSPLLNIFDKMTKLIHEEWAIKVTTEACQNLNVNRFNKSPIIPLTQDLQKMKIYLDDLISNAKIKLQENNNSEDAYRTLIEGTYCSLFLFNKRRVGELQKILLDTYLNSTGELEKLLSPSEKILLNKLKCIVIKGQHEQGVPVLIDKSTQEGIDVALEHRSNFFNTLNPYLFGSCHTGGTIRGYHIIRKHVKIALNDPNKVSCLTSTNLRKHLATVAQILKMDTDDLKQLASFMGNTAKTNSEWYRLPSNIYQTAKVSKILVLAENRCIDKYKGRNLNYIQLDPTVIETRLDSDDEQEEDINMENENKLPPITVNKSILNQIARRKARKKSTIITWTKQEKELTEKYFRKHIRKKIAPKKDEVQNFVELYPEIFSKRKWDGIKAYVCNQYNKK